MLKDNGVIISKVAQRTSIAAAEKVFPKTGSLRMKIYEFILNQGLYGATDQEIEKTLQIDGNTVRPARISLVKDGYIMDTKTTRKNKHDNDCIVWRAVEEGMML